MARSDPGRIPFTYRDRRVRANMVVSAVLCGCLALVLVVGAAGGGGGRVGLLAAGLVFAAMTVGCLVAASNAGVVVDHDEVIVVSVQIDDITTLRRKRIPVEDAVQFEVHNVRGFHGIVLARLSGPALPVERGRRKAQPELVEMLNQALRAARAARGLQWLPSLPPPPLRVGHVPDSLVSTELSPPGAAAEVSNPAATASEPGAPAPSRLGGAVPHVDNAGPARGRGVLAFFDLLGGVRADASDRPHKKLLLGGIVAAAAVCLVLATVLAVQDDNAFKHMVAGGVGVPGTVVEDRVSHSDEGSDTLMGVCVSYSYEATAYRACPAADHQIPVGTHVTVNVLPDNPRRAFIIGDLNQDNIGSGAVVAFCMGFGGVMWLCWVALWGPMRRQGIKRRAVIRSGLPTGSSGLRPIAGAASPAPIPPPLDGPEPDPS